VNIKEYHSNGQFATVRTNVFVFKLCIFWWLGDMGMTQE